jgi:hypothetical protein
MEIKVEGSPRARKFVEAILPSMLSQLKLTNSRKALLILIANDCGHDQSGVTIDLTAMTGSYLVIIKPTRNIKELGLTLAHELVHVSQMAKGLLKSTPKGDHIWANKVYSQKTPYLDMPWEIDAFSKQEILLRRAIEQ